MPAAESEPGNVFIKVQRIPIFRTNLTKLDLPWPPTLIQINNTTAVYTEKKLSKAQAKKQWHVLLLGEGKGILGPSENLLLPYNQELCVLLHELTSIKLPIPKIGQLPCVFYFKVLYTRVCYFCTHSHKYTQKKIVIPRAQMCKYLSVVMQSKCNNILSSRQ